MTFRWFFFLIVLLLSGCSLHQATVVNLSDELPTQYLESSTVATSNPALDRWWLVFKDEQLNQLMQELFAQNLELAQAYARLEQVAAAFRITSSAQRPRLSAEGTLGRSRQPGLVNDFTGKSEQLSVAAGFELDLWGKLAARSQAALSEFAAGEEELQSFYLSLSSRLADLYFLAIEQRAQLALVDQSIASFADTLARVEDRYRSGLVPAVDMHQARQSLSAAQATRPLYEAGQARAEHAIGVLLGHYPGSVLSGELTVLPPVPELFATGVPFELLENRPDLRAELKRIEAADASVAAAIADRFPSISLMGSYGSTRQELTAGLLTGEFWNLLGSLTLPVIDGGRRRAEVDRTRAVLAEAVSRYQQKVLDAFREVEDALVDNWAEAQRVARLNETSQATGSTLRLTTERYLFGLTDYLPVLTAQRADFETRSRLLSARRQLLSDRITLARALGGGWMRQEMALRLSAKKDTDNE